MVSGFSGLELGTIRHFTYVRGAKPCLVVVCTFSRPPEPGEMLCNFYAHPMNIEYGQNGFSFGHGIYEVRCASQLDSS